MDIFAGNSGQGLLPKFNSPCLWWSLCSACTQCLKETGSLLSPGTELPSHAPRTPKKILIFCIQLSTFIIKIQVWYLSVQCKRLKISKKISGNLLFGKEGRSCLLSADSTVIVLLHGGKDKLLHKLLFILKYKDLRQIFIILVTTKTQDNPL